MEHGGVDIVYGVQVWAIGISNHQGPLQLWLMTDLERGIFRCVRVHLSSIRNKIFTLHKFVADSPQMTSTRLINIPGIIISKEFIEYTPI